MPIVLLETVLGQRDLPELSFLTTRHSEFYWAVIGKQGKEEQCLGWCLTRVGRLIREEAATISHTHTHTHSLTHSLLQSHALQHQERLLLCYGLFWLNYSAPS